MPEDFPLITVRIPAYNHEKYVIRALDSVLEDDYPNKEIVIIDDGSSDHTPERIRQWISEHGAAIDVNFKQQENRGIAATINELIGMSRGEYIASLASDDYLLPGGLMRRYRYLQQHPEKAAVFADAVIVDAEGNRLHDSAWDGLYRIDKELFRTDAGIRKAFLTRWAMPGPVLMLRKSVFDIIGPYDTGAVSEDRDIYLKMASRDLLGFLDVPVSAYRIHDSNVCRDPSYEGRLRHRIRTKNTLLANRHRFSGVERQWIYRSLIRLYLTIFAYKYHLYPILKKISGLNPLRKQAP